MGKWHWLSPSVLQIEGSAVVTTVVVVLVVVEVVVVGTQSGFEQKSLVVNIPSSLTAVAHQPLPSVVTEGTHSLWGPPTAWGSVQTSISQLAHCCIFPSPLRAVAHQGLFPELWYSVQLLYSLPLYRKGSLQGPFCCGACCFEREHTCLASLSRAG